MTAAPGHAPVTLGAAELHAALASDEPPLVLDVRWALGAPDGRAHHRAGHVPTAVYVDLDTELAAPPSAAAGRHPLPDPADLQAAARRWGLRDGQPVVAYDDAGGLAAARAWWLLRWAGVARVQLLDGALAAWRSAGLPLHTGDPAPRPRGDVRLSPGHLPTLTADEAADVARAGLLLDARAAERYRGEREPVDPRAGHVPGAVCAPTTDNLDASGAFRPAATLTERFAALGVPRATTVGVYCGSGVTAAHQIAALAVAGFPAALYPGSWSAWSADPERPAATGPCPG